MFLYSLTSILVSRFLLRLQAANRASAHASSSADVNSIVFERVVGSLAASIMPGGSDCDEYDASEDADTSIQDAGHVHDALQRMSADEERGSEGTPFVAAQAPIWATYM